MVRVKTLQCLFISLLVFPGVLFGRTHATSEWLVLSHLVQAAESYAEKNSGRYPTNWNQIGEFIDLDHFNKGFLGGVALQELYVFVRDQIPVFGEQKATVFLVRVTPIEHDERGEGRYLVSRYDDGLSSIWLSERDVQKMLAQSGAKFPEPNLAEVRVAKEAVEKFLTEEVADRKIILQGVPKPTWGEIRAGWWGSIKGLFVRPAKGSFDEDALSQGAQIRPIPVAFTIIVFLGLSGLLLRRFAKRKTQTNNP